MSKKQPASKRQQRKEAVVSSVQLSTAASVRKLTGQRKPHPMLNFLLLFAGLMPFMFSWELMDSNLTLRYGIMAGFAGIFILYFFGFRKKLVNGGWPFLVKLAFIFALGYGIWNLFSFFTAVNVQQAYYEVSRYWLNLLCLFIITQVAVEEENYLVRLCHLLTVASLIHAIIGLCQYYDAAFRDLPGNYIPYGLMANRNLFGSAQVMLLPFAIFTLYRGSKPWKYIAGVAITGIFISAILAQTRSSWLAALGSLFAGLLLVSIYSASNRKKWILGTGIGLATAAALTFFFIKTDTEGELSRSLRERTSNLVRTDTTATGNVAADNIGERLKIWSKTKEVIQHNWLTGVGAGNWKVAVCKYGSEGLLWAKGKYVPDSPHNEYLLIAAESGIPGFILYFGIWVLIALTALRTIRKTENEERKILNILMLGGLAGLAIDSMFSFPLDRIEHNLYMLLMAGIILGSAINQSGEPGHKQSLKPWLIALGTLIAAFNLFMSTQKYSFEKHLVRAKVYESTKMYPQSVEEANKGKNAWVSIAANGFPIETYSGLSYKELRKYPEALQEFRQGLKYHPYNKALFVNIGTVYTVMGKYDTAIQYYKKTLEITPDFDVAFFNLAMNYFMLKDYKKCLEMLGKADIGDNKDLLNIKTKAEALVAQQAAGNTAVQQQ